MDADRHVKALQFGAACNLGIPEGLSLAVGNGTDPAGVVFYPRGVATNFVSGAGTIDFGTAQGIFWIGNHNSRSTVRFGDVAISGSGGVIFADRHATTRSSIYALYAANWQWTGPTYVDSCILGMMDAAQTEIDGDIYVRGNSMGGASLYHKAEAGGSKTFNFNGHLYLTGPSDQGLSDSQYAYSTFFASKAWNDNRTINFKGGVTVRHDVQFQSSYNANNSNRGYYKCTMNFDSSIDGDGSIHFPYNTLDAYFNKANTYSGATHIAHDTRLYVVGEGTLGKGPVTVNLTVMHNGVYKEAMLTFKNKSDYAMDNLFSGNGTIALSNSSLVFSNDVSIGKLTFDANSSAVFGGMVSASTKLTFPAGAEMSALEGATPTLTVTNGTLFAGSLADIDIVCDGVVTNMGTLAVTRIGANKRLDPIVIDGDAVFEGATFEISGIEEAMGGKQTVLSVTGAVEGEPAFAFPVGKVYAVTRTGNDWSIEKKAGLVLFVR